MTRVLLIADTERVQRIFQGMAEQGALQLQMASTLALGEFELTSFSPDFTFVQSRISGFSGDILLRHLDKLLPPEGKLVLLAGDSEDAAQAKRHGRTSLDLTFGDALLEQTIAALLAGAPLPAPPQPEAQPAPPAAKPAAKPKIAAPSTVVAGEPLSQEQYEQEETPETSEEVAPVAAAQPAPFEPTPAPPALAQEYPAAARAVDRSAASPFEEVMQQAEEKAPPADFTLPEVEDRVAVRKRADRQEAVQEPFQSPAAPDGVKGAGGYFTGETVADALRRSEQKKPRRPYLFIVPALLLIAVPLVSYLAGKTSAPEKGASPVLPKVAPPAAAPPVKPDVAKRDPGNTAKPKSPAVAPPQATPQARRGVDKLPAMLEGTKPDAEYGKTHPGWVRYVGLRAQYKLFKENDVYRAIQVIPTAGGTIADDLFKRVLGQFGGVDSYRVESTVQKGDYLVEQCATPGPASLTIYRSKNNKKIKALVVYYP